ncbi:3-ketoacyl-CoA synthase 11-like protein [Cinnamomum micranthum f. kanehirae]|uniref:3-ketoacyl-CoA synthase 11-like protein n=1 Tax=Cinnamomum micranthum f. kanehirae TaxID=337451 RepID=A0A443PC48_9MAGN|nr:3-ketoacyl-CoA synthase 11-like protein [Cinnamomum micranthum f. kanehirae]
MSHPMQLDNDTEACTVRQQCQSESAIRLYLTSILKSASSPAEPSRKLPDFKQSIKLKYVKLGYHYLITHEMYLFLLPLFVLIAAQLSTFSIQDLHDLWDQLRYSLISVILCSTLLVFLSTLYFLTRPRPVYLVDFACYKLDDARKCTRQIFMERSYS